MQCTHNRPASEVFELKKHTILAYSALEGEDWISPVSKRWYYRITKEKTVPVIL